MDAPQPQSYPRGGDFALPDVRDALNRRPERDPDPTRLAEETGHSEHEVLFALEALTVDDLGPCG